MDVENQEILIILESDLDSKKTGFQWGLCGNFYGQEKFDAAY